MSINAMKQALEALHEAVVFREGGLRKAIEAIEALRAAIQQAEAQQPATAIACGVPGMAKTTCPYCEQGFAFEYEHPATLEPVGEPRARVELMKTGGNAGLSTRIIELDTATRERLRPDDLLYTHPAPGVTDALKDHQIAAMVNTLRDIARQFHGHDSLRERIANVLVPALKAEAQQPPHATQPSEVTDSMIREAFLANGFTIKDGHSDLKPYVYAAARAILALQASAQVPMTADQVWHNDALMSANGIAGFKMDALMRIVRAVEAHHGITAQAKKETP